MRYDTLHVTDNYIPLKKYPGLRMSKSNRNNNNMFPVFKINFAGEILYANYASLSMLHDLGVTANRRLPGKFISEHLPMLEKHMNTDMVISTFDSEIFFSVVSYDEAGYIGFYAYKIKSKI